MLGCGEVEVGRLKPWGLQAGGLQLVLDLELEDTMVVVLPIGVLHDLRCLPKLFLQSCHLCRRPPFGHSSLPDSKVASLALSEDDENAKAERHAPKDLRLLDTG